MKWGGNYMITVNPTSAWSLGTPSTIGLVAAQRLNRSKGQKGTENCHQLGTGSSWPRLRHRQEKSWEQGFHPYQQVQEYSSVPGEAEPCRKAEALVCG